MSIETFILCVAVYNGVLLTMIAIRSHLLFGRANEVLRMAEIHGSMTDRKNDTTCQAIDSLKGVTTHEAEETRTKVKSAEVRLNRTIETKAAEVVQAYNGSKTPSEKST
jgi:hypothetical protein